MCIVCRVCKVGVDGRLEGWLEVGVDGRDGDVFVDVVVCCEVMLCRGEREDWTVGMDMFSPLPIL